MSNTPRMDKAARESKEQWSFELRMLCIELETELAAKAEAEKWERLHDADTAHLVSEQRRDNYGPTETLNETAIRLSRELTEVRKAATHQQNGRTASAQGWALLFEAAIEQLNEWKTLQTWGGTPQIVDEFIKGQQTRIHAAQDAEQQRDTLAEALRKIAGDRGELSAVSLSEAQSIADEALAAVKGGVA